MGSYTTSQNLVIDEGLKGNTLMGLYVVTYPFGSPRPVFSLVVLGIPIRSDPTFLLLTTLTKRSFSLVGERTRLTLIFTRLPDYLVSP